MIEKLVGALRIADKWMLENNIGHIIVDLHGTVNGRDCVCSIGASTLLDPLMAICLLNDGDIGEKTHRPAEIADKIERGELRVYKKAEAH